MKTVENHQMKFWKEGDILYHIFKDKIDVKLPEIKEIIRLRHEASENEKQYLCSDISNFSSYDKEARDYSEKYGQEFIHAGAMIVNSHITKFIFNTFALTKKVNVPFRAFKTKEAAVKWLLEIKKHNELTNS